MRSFRRLLTILLLLSLGLGMPLRAVWAGGMAPSVATLGDQAMPPDDGDRCDPGMGDAAACLSACMSAACVGTSAVLPQAILAVAAGMPVFPAIAQDQARALSVAPDLHPPKPLVLA